MYFAAIDSGMDILALIEKFWLWFQVVFGIGLMIFIHELGHFLAAKKIGVRVETFSLGFGPRLFGFRRGNTDYRLSAVPLGGYVKMAGENPDDSRTDAPDELQNRSVFERMVIFSAGVFMNFLFAFLTMPIIFAAGVPFVMPAVGEVFPGGPAWKAGLEPGDVFLEINGNTIYEFNDIPLNVALGSGERDRILIERDGHTFTADVSPEKNEEQGRYQIRISPPTRYCVVVDRDSPAERAGLLEGDRVISINGMTWEEWKQSEGSQTTQPMLLKVARETDEGETVLDITVIPEEIISEDRYLIGVIKRFNLVRGLRGKLATHSGGLVEGDFILSVGGKPIFLQGDVEEALDLEPDQPIRFRVEREGVEMEVVYESGWRESLKKDMAVALNLETNSVAILPEGPLARLQDPDIRNGIRVLSVNGTKTGNMYDIMEAIDEAASSTFNLTIGLPDGQGTKTIVLDVDPRREIYLGISFLFDYQIRKLNILEATKAGINCSLYMIKTCYLTVSRMLTGDVGSKNLGGIIAISHASYSFAKLGLARLFFFLAILSINLGFLNILPIPILDGGHLLFLLIEKIKGSPVSDRIMGYSQIVGLALVLLLLIYVTWNDILRLLN